MFYEAHSFLVNQMGDISPMESSKIIISSIFYKVCRNGHFVEVEPFFRTHFKKYGYTSEIYD